MAGKKVKTPSQLTKELLRLGELTGDKFGDVLKDLSIMGYDELIMRSAQDTGFTRSNWDVEIGKGTNDSLSNPFPSGTVAVQAKPFPPLDITIGDMVVLYNNTEYVIHLETGTAHMEAQPMVKPTVVVLEVEASTLANRLSKERIG